MIYDIPHPLFYHVYDQLNRLVYSKTLIRPSNAFATSRIRVHIYFIL